jgi:head-tail adaptor
MALKIHAGELKRRITIKQPTDGRNTQGGKERTFTTLEAGVKARITPSKLRSDSGRSNEIAPVLLNTDVIVFRYSVPRSVIAKDYLINYDGRDHVIQDIEFIGTERNRWIQLTVTANE